MSIARQVQFVNMIPAYNNGVANFPFEGSIGSDFKFKAWNVQTSWTMEYYGSKSDEALSGFRRSNVRGYRMNVTLTLDNSTENSKIRDLINKMSAGFARKVWQASSPSYSQTSSTIQLEAGTYPAVADYFNNLLAYVGTTLTGTAFRVIDFTSGGLLTLATTMTIGAFTPISFGLSTAFPSIVLFDIHGSATTYNDPDLVPCNIANIDWLLSRNWTINTQPISIQLESINLYQEIPDDYRFA